jgi:hypothetical protein
LTGQTACAYAVRIAVSKETIIEAARARAHYTATDPAQLFVCGVDWVREHYGAGPIALTAVSLGLMHVGNAVGGADVSR